MKHRGYFTRALTAKDQRFARVFDKMGYDRADLVAADELPPPAPPAQTVPDIDALRAEYQTLAGKRPYHGWDAAELTKRIAETKAKG